MLDRMLYTVKYISTMPLTEIGWVVQRLPSTLPSRGTEKVVLKLINSIIDPTAYGRHHSAVALKMFLKPRAALAQKHRQSTRVWWESGTYYGQLMVRIRPESMHGRGDTTFQPFTVHTQNLLELLVRLEFAALLCTDRFELIPSPRADGDDRHRVMVDGDWISSIHQRPRHYDFHQA